MKRFSLNQVLVAQYIKITALCCGLICLGYGFWGTGGKNFSLGATTPLVYVLIDSSQSMLVEDSINNNRLETAKHITKKIISNTKASFGLSIFAGETQIISPISQDTKTLLSLLGGIHPNRLQQQGSSISTAIQQTKNRLSIFSGSEKTLIIMSDGGEEMVNLDQETIQDYKQQGIKVIIVGLGTASGGPIILGKDVFGQIQYKIYQGKPVIVHRNEHSLKSLASQLGGSYHAIDSKHDIDELLNNIQGTKSLNIYYLLALCAIIVYMFAENIVLIFANYSFTK